MNEDRFKRGLQVLTEDVEPSNDALDRLIGKQRTREVRRRIVGGTGGLAVIAVLAVVAVQILPGEPQDPGFRGAPDGKTAKFIAYAHDGDIYVEATDGGTTRVTDDGPEVLDRAPQVHEGRVVWIRHHTDGTTALWSAGVDSTGGSAFLDAPGAIQAFTIDEGRGIALIVTESEQHRLYLTETPVGAKGKLQADQQLIEFPEFLGRGINPDDDVSVRWSPDGTKLLVVNTFIGDVTDDTLRVIDIEGEDLIDARKGTHGRWIDDDSVLYLVPGSGWAVLDVTTGTERTLDALPDDGTRPTISPDGESVAMHVESDSLPRLYVGDLTTGASLLASSIEAAVPLWLDDGTLLASGVEACEDDCAEGWWTDGTTFTVELATGRTAPMDAVISTYDASIDYTDGGAA